MKKLSSVQWSQLWEKYSKYSFLQSCFETEFKYASQKKYNTPFYAKIVSVSASGNGMQIFILKLIIWIPLFLGHFVDSILSTRIYTISRFSVPQEICSHIFIILGLHFTTLYSVLLCEVIALSPYLQNLFLHIPIPCPKYESISNISCKMCVYQNNNTKKIYFLCWKLFKWPFNNVFQTIWCCCAPSYWWFA